MFKSSLRVASIAVMATGFAAANAAVLYNQSFDGTGNGYSSQNDTTGGNGNFATVYDNFTLGSGANVSSVDFTGEYFNPPSQGNITGWTVNFYADNGGIPGSMLSTTHVNGTGNETSLGTFAGFPVFTYSVATNTNLNGGTQYWLSVVPDLGFPPQWGWSEGTGGDNAAYQVFSGAGAPLAADMAFTLNGQPVPEPASLLVLGVGALMLRRRAKKA